MLYYNVLTSFYVLFHLSYTEEKSSLNLSLKTQPSLMRTVTGIDVYSTVWHHGELPCHHNLQNKSNDSLPGLYKTTGGGIESPLIPRPIMFSSISHSKKYTLQFTAPMMTHFPTATYGTLPVDYEGSEHIFKKHSTKTNFALFSSLSLFNLHSK